MVNGISHVNEAVVNFNVGLVYRVNMRSHVITSQSYLVVFTASFALLW